MCAVAVAASQCGGGGEDDLVPEYDIEELPSTFSGHIITVCLKEINWDLPIMIPASFSNIVVTELLICSQMKLMVRERIAGFLRARSIRSQVTW
ncbi:hypothetical protein Dimus_008945 [Dionaea muscipula]